LGFRELAMCNGAAPGADDLDLTDDAVELITDRVSDVLVLPFIPAAFQELFLQQMVKIVLQQLGPDVPRAIHTFAVRNENAFDEAGLEGLVSEIVEQVEPGVSLPLLDPEQKHLCVTWVVRCVVAYSLPGAAAMLLGAEASDCGVTVLRSGVGSAAVILDKDKRKALVMDVETVLPGLPFVSQRVQHSAIEWCVDTIAALLTAAIPSEIAATLVCFSDEELRLLEDKLCEAAVDAPTPLDLMMDRVTKEALVRAAIPRMFSLRFGMVPASWPLRRSGTGGFSQKHSVLKRNMATLSKTITRLSDCWPKRRLWRSFRTRLRTSPRYGSAGISCSPRRLDGPRRRSRGVVLARTRCQPIMTALTDGTRLSSKREFSYNYLRSAL
jgi:hypothetical protein